MPGYSRVCIVSPRAATCPTVGLPIRYQIEARIIAALEAAKTRYEQRAAAGASKLDANSHAERLALQPAPNLDAPRPCIQPADAVWFLVLR
jgi:hypothetical protein